MSHNHGYILIASAVFTLLTAVVTEILIESHKRHEPDYPMKIFSVFLCVFLIYELVYLTTGYVP